MDARRAELAAIVAESAPCSVRQVFYQATVRGIVDKSEAAYGQVKADLKHLRWAGTVPWSAIADGTRWMRRPRVHGSLEEALEEAAEVYRRDAWRQAAVHVEVWLEKEALAGVLYPATARYAVPLMVARGYASLSFLHGSAEAIRDAGKPAVIAHLGDFDPSGQDAARAIRDTLRQLAPEADITFVSLGVTPAQVEAWRLPSRPTKASDARAKSWTGKASVELDAIPAPQLRQLVTDFIEEFVDLRHLAALEAAEESERDLLRVFARVAAERAVR